MENFKGGIIMTKTEREQCVNLMYNAVAYAKQADTESKAALEAHLNNDAIMENIELQLYQQHIGLAEGIHDVLAALNFKHSDMDVLNKLL